MGFLAQVVTRDVSESVLTRQEALRRLGELSDAHREALLLTSWDGLSAEEAALAAGVSPATFRKRLSRARARLADDPAPPDVRDVYRSRVMSPKELP
jgi:DNA-directed RNA polymerase specialized sigma24 family protein